MRLWTQAYWFSLGGSDEVVSLDSLFIDDSAPDGLKRGGLS